LIGVGDLATPRWTSDTRQFNWDTTIASAPPLHEEPEDNDADGNDDRDDGADSPWTIEAVDSNNEAGDSDNPPSQVRAANASFRLPPSCHCLPLLTSLPPDFTRFHPHLPRPTSLVSNTLFSRLNALFVVAHL